MKSYTDIEQSKKLAEILPLESADMRYHTISHCNPYPCDEIVYTVDFDKASHNDIPCWSLAALLELMPDVNFYKRGNKTKIENTYRTIRNDISLIDAAFEMIVWLKENVKI